jgi:hypothetical protein
MDLFETSMDIRGDKRILMEMNGPDRVGIGRIQFVQEFGRNPVRLPARHAMLPTVRHIYDDRFGIAQWANSRVQHFYSILPFLLEWEISYTYYIT